MTWRTWIPRLALILILAGQINYLPQRLDYVQRLLAYARLEDPLDAARLAYGAADYDLLEWVRQNTAPDTTLLLVTASEQTYGDPSYVLYHRAIYHLYPRDVWWAAPVEPKRYPAWWSPVELGETELLRIAARHRASVILSAGFSHPPIQGSVLTFDEDTYLIFLDGRL
jgi:hypothetical protein